MSKYGLCGKTLKHSYSEIIHNLLGNHDYALLNMSKEDFCDFMKKRAFCGVNVTIPYKTDALAACDEVSPEAAKIGSVNTVINRAGRLYGYNTDYFGFSYMLDRAKIDVTGKKTLVLGTGGTSLTARHVLADRKAAEVLIVSRTGTLNYQNVYDHTDAAIIVNTTPVGMFPHNGESPIDLTKFPKLCGAVDVIYNPLRTAFISQALSREIPAVSGLSMLVAQAVAAHEYFFDKPFANRTQVIEDILRQCTARVCNLVLVGMPGSGKTTVGKKIAALTGLPFYDADDVFAETFGKTPETVINEDGEAVFRGMETGVLKELTKRSGCIIATGGGAVKKAENRVLLKQNGYVAYIERDVEKLATDGRPLSAGGAERLKKLFEERDGLYKAVADRSFPIRENPEACAKDMIEAFGFSLLNEKTEGRE